MPLSWITDFAAFDHWTRPLNLMRAASLLRQRGWSVDFYDCLDRLSPDLSGLPRAPRHRFNSYGCGHYYQEEIPRAPVLNFVPRKYRRHGVPPERVEARLRGYSAPDVVLIPCMMTYWYPGAFEAVQMMRRVFPRAKVVLGGVYATLCREHAVRHSGADAVLVGKHWPDLINQIHDLLGLSDRCPGDQSTWIEPAYDLANPQETCFPLLTSTGCPCHCTYCATHSLWPHYIYYEIGAIVDSLERLVKDHGATDIAFFDDALLSKKEKHFIPLMEEILCRNLFLRFHTPNALHVRQIDRTVAELLKRAGFTTIRLGLEVVQRDWQKATGGKVYTPEYLETMRHLRAVGFTANEVGTYVILGMPEQSIDLIWEACRIVLEAGSEMKLTMYSPLPHTPLFTRKDPHFLFDPQTDPLLQNNTLTPWRSSDLPYQEYLELKNFVVAKNQELRKSGVFS